MRKAICICLIIAMFVMLVPVTYSAGTPELSVATVNGLAGTTVSVNITIKNNPGIVMANIKIAYDSSKAELVGVKNGSIFPDASSLFSFSQELTDNPLIVGWIYSGTENLASNGRLLTLDFKIKSTAQAGTSSPVTVTYDEQDIMNVDLVPVHFDINNGSVIVARDSDMHYVTLIDGYDNTLIDTLAVEHGMGVLFPNAPDHTQDGYDFERWSDAGTRVITDMTITALYSRRQHTVTFIDGYDDSIISTETVYHGDSASYPQVISHISNGYYFYGWDKGCTDIISDTTITALYKVLSCTVTFVDGFTDEVLQTTQAEYGTSVLFPNVPDHSAEGYGFVQWTDNGISIIRDTVITAIYRQFGDANGDGKLNTGDATRILRYSVGLDDILPKHMDIADINRDGNVNTGDAVGVLRSVVGIGG